MCSLIIFFVYFQARFGVTATTPPVSARATCVNRKLDDVFHNWPTKGTCRPRPCTAAWTVCPLRTSLCVRGRVIS